MFVACKTNSFSGNTRNILHWILGPYGPPEKMCVSHLWDGHLHLLACKTIHVPLGPKKVRFWWEFRP